MGGGGGGELMAVWDAQYCKTATIFNSIKFANYVLPILAKVTNWVVKM